MKKLIASLIIAAAAIPASYAHAGGHISYGRVAAYTATAVVTAGVVNSLCCSRSYGSSYGYDRERDNYRYIAAQREQDAYDRGIRDAYYAPPPPRVVYYAPPPPPPQRVIYIERQPTYYPVSPVYSYPY